MSYEFMDMKYKVDPDCDTPDQTFEEWWDIYGKGWATEENFGYDPDVDGLKKFANAFYEMGVEDGKEFGVAWQKKPFSEWEDE